MPLRFGRGPGAPGGFGGPGGSGRGPGGPGSRQGLYSSPGRPMGIFGPGGIPARQPSYMNRRSVARPVMPIMPIMPIRSIFPMRVPIVNLNFSGSIPTGTTNQTAYNTGYSQNTYNHSAYGRSTAYTQSGNTYQRTVSQPVWPKPMGSMAEIRQFFLDVLNIYGDDMKLMENSMDDTFGRILQVLLPQEAVYLAFPGFDAEEHFRGFVVTQARILSAVDPDHLPPGSDVEIDAEPLSEISSITYNDEGSFCIYYTDKTVTSFRTAFGTPITVNTRLQELLKLSRTL